MPRKSISFTEHHDDWMKAQVSSGQYANESELVRDLIRERQRRDEELAAIRSELILAEQSPASDKTADQIRLDAKRRLKADRGA